jgi:hypothetical protein
MRSTRLQTDEGRITTLARQSGGRVRVESAVGRPPSKYLLELRCRGVRSVSHGRVTYGDTHLVEILLGPEYPFAEPTVRMKTPIVHPHVWSSNKVCLGGWKTAEFLDLLVERLFKVIQYFPEFLDAGSVANRGAGQWAKDNMNLFPLGTVVPGEDEPRGTPPKPKIVFSRS